MDRADEATESVVFKINRNCTLKGRFEYNITLNKGIFLYIFLG